MQRYFENIVTLDDIFAIFLKREKVIGIFF